MYRILASLGRRKTFPNETPSHLQAPSTFMAAKSYNHVFTSNKTALSALLHNLLVLQCWLHCDNQALHTELRVLRVPKGATKLLHRIEPGVQNSIGNMTILMYYVHLSSSSDMILCRFCVVKHRFAQTNMCIALTVPYRRGNRKTLGRLWHNTPSTGCHLDTLVHLGSASNIDRCDSGGKLCDKTFEQVRWSAEPQ